MNPVVSFSSEGLHGNWFKETGKYIRGGNNVLGMMQILLAKLIFVSVCTSDAYIQI